jgi:hypothetical protein
LTWLTSFVVEGRPANTALLAEAAAIHGSHEIRINGILLPQPSPARVYDCMNIRYEIPEEVFAAAQRRFYQRGVWIVSLAIDAVDPEDGLREPLHLIGDFEAALVKGQSAGARIAPCADKRVATGSWTQQGFPYFAGSISYAQDMELEHGEEDRSYRLSIECGGDCAEVTVNGTSCGARCWPPWEVEIGSCLRPGRNRIEISVTNTMENMLVGAGNPAGLLGPVTLIVS